MREKFTFLLILVVSLMMGQRVSAANYDVACYDCSIDWCEGIWVDYTSPARPYFNGWNVVMKGKQGERIIVCILDMDKKKELIDGRTYTSADIVTDWTGVTLFGKSEELSIDSDIAYTQTHDDEGKLHVVFDMTGKNGNTYHVTYDEKCDMIGEMQELTFNDDQVTLINNTLAPGVHNFQIVAEIPGEVSVMVAVDTDRMEGVYATKDIIDDFSDITWGDVNNGEYSVLKFCDVDMKVTADAEHPGAYFYDITMITKVGRGYHTVLHSNPWEKPNVIITETKTITADNLRMMDYRESWGELLFVASCPGYSVNLYARSKDVQGTYTKDDIDFEYNFIWYVDENGEEKKTTAIDGEYTYAEAEDGSRSLTGWLDCANGVKYILDLHYTRVESTRKEEVRTDDAVIDDRRTPDGGGIIILGQTAEQYILMGIFTQEIAGKYTEQDVDWQSTFIVEFREDMDDDYVLELLDADIEVKDCSDGQHYEVEAHMTMQAEMDKTDIVDYDIFLTAFCPTNGSNNIEEVTGRNVKVRKIMRNGRVIIAADDNLYNTQGVRMK